MAKKDYSKGNDTEIRLFCRVHGVLREQVKAELAQGYKMSEILVESLKLRYSKPDQSDKHNY